MRAIVEPRPRPSEAASDLARRPEDADPQPWWEPSPRVRRGGRVAAYVGSIVVNGLLLYVVQAIPDWNLPFVNSAWSQITWALALSLEVSIAANALYLVYDAAWFKHLGSTVCMGFSAVAAYWMFVVFPFDLGSAGVDQAARLALFVFVLLMGLGTIGSLMATMAALLRGLEVDR